MVEQTDLVLKRVKVREVASVFRSQDALDAAVQDLLHAGFDRADIDLMADIETRDEAAQRVLREHGAEAVRIHEIEIDKRWEDLPLHNLHDPWLGGDPRTEP